MKGLAGCGIAVFSVLAAGCATVEDNWRDARAVTNQARTQEFSNYSEPAAAVLSVMPFDQFRARVIEKDPEVGRLDAEVEHGRLQWLGARSMVMPRFSLRFSSDVPLDAGRGWEDRQATGGLHIDYDVVRALFADAEVAVAEAQMRQSESARKLAIRDLEWAVVRLVLKHRRAMETARIAGDAALVASLAQEGIASLQGGSGAEGWRWRSELDSRQSAERMARAEAERAMREMNRRVGLAENANLEIADEEDLLARVEAAGKRIPEKREMVKQALESEERLQMAESRLFLSRMAVEKARRSRWPSIRVGIGVGEFYLAERDETAHVMGQVQVSYPLWDAGDRERDLQAAMLQRSRAEYGVRETSAAVAKDVSAAYQEWNQVRDELLAAESWLQTVDGRIAMAAGGAGVSATAELRMLRLAAELRLLDAQYRAREATIALLEAGGESIDTLGPATGVQHESGR